MDSMLENLISGLYEIFPDVQGTAFTSVSILGELPEWDSMAAVNLQTYLLHQFEVEVPLEFLDDETTLDEVVGFLKHTVGKETMVVHP